ncbi:hypothetical protein ACQ4M5_20965 [Leptolyngbya sp. AN10]
MQITVYRGETRSNGLKATRRDALVRWKRTDGQSTITFKTPSQNADRELCIFQNKLS